MSASVFNIKELLHYLPSDDIIIGKQLLEKRDFEGLLELVTSSIVRVKKGQNKEVVPEKYASINTDFLYKLEFEVESYLDQLRIPEQEQEEYYLSDSYQEKPTDFFD